MKSVLLAVPLLMVFLTAQDKPARPASAPLGNAQAATAHTAAELAFLAGKWRGGDGQSEWESWYSSPEGGQVIGASKELRGGHAVSIDFENFYEREGALRMTPFPKGQRSEEFTLTSLSAPEKRAVFENPQHDFPSRFVYQRVDETHLRITLSGAPGGEPLEVTIDFERRAD